MVQFLIVFLAGMAVMLVTALVFYNFVGQGAAISSQSADWALFGDYFGGVAGTILAFVSVILFFYTILQQRKALEHTQDEALKLDVLRFLAKLDEDIESWLRRELAREPNQLVQFGDIVRGIVPSRGMNLTELSAANERLLQITCQYCAAIQLYQVNTNEPFIYRYHAKKADELLTYLSKNLQSLNSMAQVSISNCQNCLDG